MGIIGKRDRIRFAAAALAAVTILVASYVLLSPGRVVANESSDTYVQEQVVASGDGGSARIAQSAPVGASELDSDPDGASQALGASELVEPVEGGAAESKVVGGDEYVKTEESRFGDGTTMRVFESQPDAGDGADSGLGTSELVEVG